MADGWKAWKGGEAPVGPDDLVLVAYRACRTAAKDNAIRRRYGPRWRSHWRPRAAWEAALRTCLVLALIGGAYVVVAINDANATAASVERSARIAAESQRALVEAHLAHLMNGGVLIADTDFMTCRMRDRASTSLTERKTK